MIETLNKNGWTQTGTCSPCGTIDFVSPQHPKHVIRVKKGMNIFKLLRENREVYSYTSSINLGAKLKELET